MFDDTATEPSMGTDSPLMVILESIVTQETTIHTSSSMLPQAANMENEETSTEVPTGETGNEGIKTDTIAMASRNGGGEMRMDEIGRSKDIDSHTLVNLCGPELLEVNNDEKSYGPSPSGFDLVVDQEHGSNGSPLYSSIEGIHQTDNNLTEEVENNSRNFPAELGKFIVSVSNSRKGSPISSSGIYSPAAVPCSPFSSPHLAPTSSSPLSSPIQFPFSSSPLLDDDEDHAFLLNKTDATTQMTRSLFDKVQSDLCDSGTNGNNGTVLPDGSVENTEIQGTNSREILRVQENEKKLNIKPTIPKNEFIYLPPNPKRPTAASHKLQHAKLSKPFRPPGVIQGSNHQQHNNQVLVDAMASRSQQKGSNPPGTKNTRSAEREMKYKQDDWEKHRTTRASAQFKSPLLLQQDSTRATPTFRLTPTIQTLERKLQILKRAIKIKEDDQEGAMRDLITKWTNAGREVAWEVWTFIRENIQEVSVDGRRPYCESWGWKSPPSKRLRLDDKLDDSTQLDDRQEVINDNPEEVSNSRGVSEDEESPGEPHHTLGTMLRHLGIDPQTLGWNDADEVFEDECEER